MIRRSNSRSVATYLLYLVLVASVYESVALGQSAANSSTLQVLSAEYVPGKPVDLLREPDSPRGNVTQSVDMIRFRLVNNGQRAATAYVIDVNVTNAGSAFSFKHSVDMLSLVLNGRCTSGSGDSWEGAIKPGDVYSESIAVNLGKSAVADPSKVGIHAAITGIIWSDGSVDAQTESGRAQMRRYQDRRQEEARDEAKVIAILDAHQGDPDSQHRISEVTKGVDFLVSIRPNVQEAAPGSPTNQPIISKSSHTFFEATQNLRGLTTSPHPAEQFEGWSSIFVCRHKQRVALQQPDSMSKSIQ
ncbi:MAG TPA: hypothetical protein VMH04_20770 [Candidatus Solibacter sp.]|nr:hypothetical protein [Candidatus Solibacter sp.]